MLDAVRAGATFQTARDRSLPTLTEQDRRLAYELAAGVLRRRAQLDRTLSLESVDPRLHDILRLGAYQLRALTRVPPYAAVSTSVDLAREIAGEGGARYVNQALRKLTGARGRVSGVGASHPAWLVRRWKTHFGEADATRLIAWNDRKPTLTVQPVRWEQETLARRLLEAGLGVTEAPFGAGLRLTLTPETRHLTPGVLPGFAEGAFIVQDPAHALLCRYAAIPPGTVVYDACAAPGGKATMLERSGARVVAGDARRGRLGPLRETTRRAGVAIRVAVADLLAAPFRQGAFAAVLVDAPCSATGTMAHHPDARWRVTLRAIARAAARQRALLAAAAELVRPGGMLVYATCSLEPEENSDIVTDFLARHPHFVRAPATAHVPAALLTADGDFQTLPQRDGTDGAYAARLLRSR
jgi:16S rRNA (cytosine967-C5)-methyltransferase